MNSVIHIPAIKKNIHKDIQVNNSKDNSTTWFTILAYMNECTHGVLIGSFRCKMKQNIQPCSTCRPALSFGWAWPKKGRCQRMELGGVEGAAERRGSLLPA